jgi:hypothetical protein
MYIRSIIAFIVIILSCQSSKKSCFEFDPLKNDKQKIFLSDLAEDITYVGLDNELTIGKIRNIKFIGNSIYIKEKDIGIIRYDRNGKNPRIIGRIGRGPGEFQIGKSFAVNEKKGVVYVLDSKNNIFVYNQNGTFLKNISLAGYSAYFDEIELVEDNLLISEEIKFGRAKYNWIFTDTLGKVIKEKMNPLPAFKSRLGMHGGLIKCNKRILYWNIYNDTVYSVLPDMSYSVSFLFKKGDFRVPPSQYDHAKFQNYMTPYQIFETNDYLVIHYFYHIPKLKLVDKRTGESSSIDFNYVAGQGGTELIGGIENNLDGGLPFQPESYYSDRNEYLIGWIDPLKLKGHLNKTSNLEIKYPEKKKELEKLAASLKETDNPVLVLVRLKK